MKSKLPKISTNPPFLSLVSWRWFGKKKKFPANPLTGWKKKKIPCQSELLSPTVNRYMSDVIGFFILVLPILDLTHNFIVCSFLTLTHFTQHVWSLRIQVLWPTSPQNSVACVPSFCALLGFTSRLIWGHDRK